MKKYKTEKCFITKSVASETGQEKYVQNAKKTVKFLKKFGVDWAKTKLKQIVCIILKQTKRNE